MAEWYVEVSNLVPHGQLAELLTIAKIDRRAKKTWIVEATMRETSPFGSFPVPSSDSPLTAFGCDMHSEIDLLLQAIMDCAWQRGLRPKKLDPSAGELAAVKAHLEDMRKLAGADAPQMVRGLVDEVDLAGNLDE